MEEKEWLMLDYVLPQGPSRVRVSVWRKLKKCGSVSIGQSLWILPYMKEQSDKFEEIESEVVQNNGKAYIIKAVFINKGSPDEIIELFNSARDEEYRELLDKCEDFFREIDKETQIENFCFAEFEENEDELDKLFRWYEKITARDFFTASLKSTSEQELEKCKQLLDEFGDKVYQANHER